VTNPKKVRRSIKNLSILYRDFVDKLKIIIVLENAKK